MDPISREAIPFSEYTIVPAASVAAVIALFSVVIPFLFVPSGYQTICTFSTDAPLFSAYPLFAFAIRSAAVGISALPPSEVLRTSPVTQEVASAITRSETFRTAAARLMSAASCIPSKRKAASM